MLDVPITEVTDHTQKEPNSAWWGGGSGILGSASLDLAG